MRPVREVIQATAKQLSVEFDDADQARRLSTDNELECMLTGLIKFLEKLNHLNQVVTRIANTNTDDVAARVFRIRNLRDPWDDVNRHPWDDEIEKAAAEKKAGIRDILAMHQPEDIARLRDYVVLLIFAKLTQQSDEHPPGDPFLGHTDLREYLLKRPYTLEEVDDLTASLGPPIPLGDLRAWLCSRKAKHQLYTHRELDLSLRESDISEFRIAVREQIGSDPTRSQKERQDALREHDKRPDYFFLSQLSRGIPLQIMAWAEIVTCQLLTGTCDCPAAHQESDRAARAAETRCRTTHFLSERNLADALEGRQPQQKKKLKTPLDFVVRAVVETSYKQLAKSFANTMLANVFVTPGGNKLRQNVYVNERGEETTGIMETGRERQMDQLPTGRRASSTTFYRTFGCYECKSFVAEKHASCIRGQHRWLSAVFESESNFDDGIKVSISLCQSGHFWPSKNHHGCPWCGQQPVKSSFKFTIYLPVETNFDDLEWKETILCR
jgi:hypothetical protein